MCHSTYMLCPFLMSLVVHTESEISEEEEEAAEDSEGEKDEASEGDQEDEASTGDKKEEDASEVKEGDETVDDEHVENYTRLLNTTRYV